MRCRYSVSRMGDAPGWSRIRWPLLTVFAFLLLGPIWLFRHLPLVDYPDHLARAYVLTHLDDPAYGGFYRAAWGPYPYLAGDLLLVALQKVVPIDVAGRLLLSLCALSVPAASWLFLRRANPGSAMLAIWSLPLSYNLFFLSGFMNMQLSIASCLVAIALWLGWLQQPRWSGWLGLFLLVNVLYFTHPMGFAVAAFTVGLYSLLVPAARREIPRSWALFVPGALLYVYASTHAGLRLQSGAFNLSERIASPLTALKTHYLALDVISIVVILGCVMLALFHREFRWNRPWLEISIGLYVISMLLPSGGLTIINVRIMPFLCLVALAAGRPGRRIRALALAGVLVFALRMGGIAGYFASEQAELRAMETASDSIPRGARLLPLIGWRGDSLERWSYAHVWAQGVIHRGWRSPYLFHERGVHPLAIAVEMYTPEPILPAMYREPLDWERIARDYDYVWADNVPSLLPDLENSGQQIHQSGSLRIFALKKPLPHPARRDPPLHESAAGDARAF